MEKFTASKCEDHLKDIFEAISISPEQEIVDLCIDMLHRRLMSGDFDPEESRQRKMSEVNPIRLAMHRRLDRGNLATPSTQTLIPMTT